jgi:CsoR family transcriptional regulator, copper-sensing transcriptional repressor
MAHEHPHRREVAKRMARVSGHVDSIKKMLESDRACDEILQQMTAVIRAMEAAREAVLEDHLETCIAGAARDGRGEEALDELRKTLKFAFR